MPGAVTRKRPSKKVRGDTMIDFIQHACPGWLRGARQAHLPTPYSSVFAITVAVVFATVFGLAGCATSQTPENIHFQKERLSTYYQSGGYETDVGKLGAQVEVYLQTRLTTPGKYAVVFDIDETTLSNYPALKANDYGWLLTAPCKREADGKLSSPCGLLPWILMGSGTAIKPIQNVYKTAQRLGAKVYLITGRPETPEMRAATEKNLREAGYSDWAEVVLKPTNVKLTTVEYKSGARKRITEAGYTVVASVGDQMSDLDGGYAERGFLVPNPFYFIP
jgi:predicted secreted acid phosphatase